MLTLKSEQAELVVRAVLSLARRLRSERPERGVSLAVVALLATLKRLGPLPAYRLAEEQGLQPQSLTRMLRTLEANGWIAREGSEEDRREVRVELTAQGLAIFEDDMQARRRWLEAAMSENLTVQECETLIAAAMVMLNLAGSKP